MTARIPKAGDIWFVDLDPTVGHEQAKARPVLVVSPDVFNKASGQTWVMPITSRIRGNALEIVLSSVGAGKTQGAILIHHLRSVDMAARGGRYIEAAPAGVLRAAQERAQLILGAKP